MPLVLRGQLVDQRLDLGVGARRAAWLERPELVLPPEAAVRLQGQAGDGGGAGVGVGLEHAAAADLERHVLVVVAADDQVRARRRRAPPAAAAVVARR